MENQLPILKSYDIDYSFIIKNYLNPEMWQKTWTLFQYKTFIVTLNIAYINCQDEKITFKVKVKDNSESTVYSYDFMNNIDKEAKRDAYYSLKINDLEFLKREISNSVLDAIETLERYYIYATPEYKKIEEGYKDEENRLENIANEFLDNNNVTNKDIRDAYISVFVSDNAKTDDYKAQYVDNARYTIFSDFYLTYAYATKDEKIISKWEEILSESNNIEQLKQEIREYLDFMETTEYVEEMSGRLEDL